MDNVNINILKLTRKMTLNFLHVPNEHVLSSSSVESKVESL
jgi:hypothetical protein